MSERIYVFLNGKRCGELEKDNPASLPRFRYDPAYLTVKGKIPLSRSLPPRADGYSDTQSAPFFASLLPARGLCEKMAEAAQLPFSASDDTLRLLKRFGGDCAGGVSFYRNDTLPDEEDYLELDEDGLTALIDGLAAAPFASANEKARQLLPGERLKTAVRLHNGAISLPLGAAASNYLLKTDHPRFPDSVYNEASCARIAARAGLDVASVIPCAAGAGNGLLVKRYDRHTGEDGAVTRIHQESFCQALGLPPERKRQKDAGPDLAACFALLRAASAAPVIDVLKLFDAVVFNALIGNNNMHGGKYALLYEKSGVIRLAPLYDVMSTDYYAACGRNAAMAIGGEYDSAAVTRDHLERLANDTGLSAKMAVRRAFELAENIREAAQRPPFGHPEAVKVTDFIKERAETFLKRFWKR